MTRRYFAALTAWCLAAQERKCSATGDFEIVPFPSAVFPSPRALRVLLPPRYRTDLNRRYPVLYLNDGQNLFDVCTAIWSNEEWRVDETVAALIEHREIEPLIVVGVDHGGRALRAKEYLPWGDDTLRPPMDDPEGRLYPQFLMDEVVPHIEGRYRVAPGTTNRGLGGSSYGAGIALYTVIQRPSSFGALLLESPSVYADDYHLMRDAADVRQWPRRVYIGTGTVREPLGDVRKLELMFRKAGLRQDRLRVVIQRGGEHSERWWADRLPTALKFLFPRRS